MPFSKIPRVRSNDSLFLLIGLLLMLVACLVIFSWSSDVVSIWRFVLGVGLYVIGFSISQVECISIYSKVVGNLRPGLLMGLLTGVGALSRIIGPVIAGILFVVGAMDFTMSVSFLILSVLFAVVCIGWPLLQPPKDRYNAAFETLSLNAIE